MSKSTKLLLVILTVLLVVSIIVIVALPRLLNPNNYKAEIAAMIKEKTGRDVIFKGNITVSVFPSIGLSAEKIEIGNKPGFMQPPFMAVEKSDIKIKLFPFLINKVEIKFIALDGLDLNLIKDKQGINNWDGLQTATPALKPSVKNAKNLDYKANAQSVLSALAIGELNVHNARVSWNNQQTGEHLEFTDIRFSLDNFVFAKGVKINTAMDVSGDLVKMPLSIKLATELLVNEGLDGFVLSDSLIEGVGFKKTTNGQSLAATVTIPIANVNISQQTFRLSGLQMNSGDFKFTADIVGEQFLDKPSIKGSAAIAPFNTRNFMKQWDMTLSPMNDPTAFSHLSVIFDFWANPDQAEFSNIDASIDNSHATGIVKVKGFAQPKVSFNLSVDNVDADRYLALQDKADTTNFGMPFAPGTVVTPLDLLRKLGADGTLTLGKMTLNRLFMQDIRLTLSSKNGVIKTSQGMDKQARVKK